MHWRVSTSFTVLQTTAIMMLSLLVPGAAVAGSWGENWGEMLWGATIPVPSMSTEGLFALALLLLLSSLAFRSRCGRGKT
jgi:hypothetical protein